MFFLCRLRRLSRTSQHKELRRWLGDAKRLWLYAQAADSMHRVLEESLGKAQSWSKHWEREAKESFEKTTGEEKERDEAKKEAHVARLAIFAASDARAKLEGDLARVKDALVAAKETKVVAEEAMSNPESRSDPIGGSEPSSGCETQDWDSLPEFYFFKTELVPVGMAHIL